MMISTCSQPGASVSHLVRAAEDFDADAVTDIVRASIDQLGVAWTWEQLIAPAWGRLRLDSGDRAATLAPERLFSRTVGQALAATRPRNRTPAQVLVCADEEHPTLPLDAVAAALAELGASSCVLGARVPPQALASAVRRLRPAVVLIWSQTRNAGGPWPVTALLAACAGAQVITAGPGWDLPALPAPAVPAGSVVAAVGLTLALLAAVRSAAQPESGPEGRATTPGRTIVR
jgi:MerR family transcriptional regulator, light-induced transcriptional regulator